MIRLVLAGAAIAAGVTAVLAQTDVIAERKNLMKSNGAATRLGTQMAKGEAPFDPAKAAEIFATYQAVGKRFPTLFPPDSKTGDTAAAPKIWEDMPGFRATAAKLASDAEKAASSTKDVETFRVAFGEVTKNCNACHQTYRINKN
jgi:cytochrome c556